MSAKEQRPVVVDTNILFSALLQPNHRFLAVLASGPRFYISETVLAEIFRHKEKIRSLSRLDDDDLERAYHALVAVVDLYKEAAIPDDAWHRAYGLCRDVDPKDAAHVALTLALDGLLWTGDKALRRGLMEKGFDRFFSPW